jgi:pyridoxal phosphate enzyme (YggS family)
MDSAQERLNQVVERIQQAAQRSGREPQKIALVAVSKTVPFNRIIPFIQAGVHNFGENRVQEALQKIASAADLLDMRWHLLGHLQTNKARKAAPAFDSIQSVDSIELIQKIDAAAVETGRTPELLIQVDLAGEATKFGVSPTEVPRLLEAAAACRAARVTGLMTLPPVPESPEDARPWFARLRGLRDQWLASGVPAPMLRELSMGMSADFEVAVQEGSTMVRVGTAIFGSRT